MANRRFIDFPVATTVGANDIILIWQDGLNKQTTKATILSGLPEDLEDLADVNISGLTNGQILRYDSTTGKWVNTDQGNLDLGDLNDVSIVSPSNGQVLVYNSSTSKWENSSAGFVPYTGAVTTVNLGAQTIQAGSFVKAGGTSAQFLKADGSVDSNTYGTGTVTSVGLTMPAAFSVANSPVTTAGTLAVTGAGTTAQYIRGDGTLATFPGLTGFVPYTGATADVNLGTHDLAAERGTFENNGSSNTLTVNHTSGSGYGIIVTKGGNNEALYVSKTSGSGNAMTVVGGRTSLVDLALSSVTNTAGDFLTISGGVVHKRTAAEVRTDIGAGTGNGTVTSVAALTLGTSGTDLSSTVANGTTTPVITLNVPTASASNRGALSAADWSTFNGKQNALTNPVTGTGASGQVAYFNGTTTITSESNLFWDATNDRLGIGTASPTSRLQVNGGSFLNSGSSGAYPSAGDEFGGSSSLASNVLRLSTSGWRNAAVLSALTGSTAATRSTTGLILNSIYGSKSYASSSINVNCNTGNGTIEFFIGGGNDAPTERMRITSTGNVLIGNTTDNGARLQVNTSGSSAFIISRTGASDYGFEIGGTTFGLYDYTNSFYRWRTDGNNLLLAESNGNVGIGTDSPEGKLHIDSGISDVSADIYLSSPSTIGANGGTGAIYFGSGEGPGYTSAAIKGFSLSDFNLNDTPGYLTFSTTPDGSATLQERMRITSDGNVGIGTTSPGAKLDVANSADLIFNLTRATVGTWGFNVTTGGNLFLNNRFGTNVFQIADGGNVLIGTTTDAGFKLDVNGTGRFSGASNLSTTVFTNTGNDGGIDVINSGTLANGRTSQLRLTNGTTFFGANDRTYQLINIGTSSTLSDFYIQYWNGSTYLERFRITSSGNVGIGTSAPGAKLDLWTSSSEGGGNTLRFTNATTSIANGGIIGKIEFYSRDASVPGPSVKAFIASVSEGTSPDGALVFATDTNTGTPTERMRITSGGNVGIGTTSPGAKLDVTTSFGSQLIIGFSGNPDNFYDANNHFFRTAFGISNTLSMVGGNVGIGTTAPSDKLHVANNGTGAYSAALWTNSNSTANLYVGVGGSAVLNTPLQNNAYVMNAAASGLAFGTSDAVRMFITSSGNVLIGTTTDVGAKLYVEGAIRTGAPSGGSAVNWKLGTSRGGPVVTNATVRVEIDGVLVDLVARYV